MWCDPEGICFWARRKYQLVRKAGENSTPDRPGFYHHSPLPGEVFGLGPGWEVRGGGGILQWWSTPRSFPGSSSLFLHSRDAQQLWFDLCGFAQSIAVTCRLYTLQGCVFWRASEALYITKDFCTNKDFWPSLEDSPRHFLLSWKQRHNKQSIILFT